MRLQLTSEQRKSLILLVDHHITLSNIAQQRNLDDPETAVEFTRLVRDQNNLDLSLRRKRLMMMLHLFLIHRYGAEAIHYVSPTADNHRLAEFMEKVGIYDSVSDEVGEIIVAHADSGWLDRMMDPNGEGIVGLFTPRTDDA